MPSFQRKGGMRYRLELYDNRGLFFLHSFARANEHLANASYQDKISWLQMSLY
jgi:hypothetical protein